MSVSVHVCPLLSAHVCLCPFMSVPVRSCQFISVSACDCPCFSICFSFCPFLCPFLCFVLKWFWYFCYYPHTLRDSMSPMWFWIGQFRSSPINMKTSGNCFCRDSLKWQIQWDYWSNRWVSWLSALATLHPVIRNWTVALNIDTGTLIKSVIIYWSARNHPRLLSQKSWHLGIQNGLFHASFTKFTGPAKLFLNNIYFI